MTLKQNMETLLGMDERIINEIKRWFFSQFPCEMRSKSNPSACLRSMSVCGMYFPHTPIVLEMSCHHLSALFVKAKKGLSHD